MATVGVLRIGVRADTGDFDSGMKKARGTVTEFTAAMQMGSPIAFDFFNGLNMVGSAAKKLSRALGSVIMASADQSEATDLVRVQFGKYADTVINGADEMAAKHGTAKTAFLSNVGTLEGILGSMNKGGEATADLAVQFGKLAVDMESAFNSDFSAEMDRIRSGLTGSSEPLQRYGVNLLATNVQQEAYRMGLAKVGEELTESQKIAARTNIIFRDLGKVLGNKELTSGSTANKVKELGGRFENLKADVGSAVEVIANGFLVTMGEGLLEVLGGTENLKASVQEWAKASLQSGGVINEAFGWVGEGIAFTLDMFSYGKDVIFGFYVAINNIMTSVVTGVIDVASGIGGVFTAVTGVELGFIQTLETYSDVLSEQSKVLNEQRDNMFAGSEIAQRIRDFTERGQSRLDEIGRAGETVIEGVKRTALESVEKVGKAGKLDLADASTFGSSAALSAINRQSLRSDGADEGVKVAKESLTVERQALEQLRMLNLNIPKLALDVLDIV